MGGDLSQRVEMLLDAGRAAQALPLLDRAIARDPGDAVAHFYRILVLQELGQPERAAEALDRLAKLDGDLAAEANLLHGLLALGGGNRTEARRHLELAVDLDTLAD